MHAPSRDHLAPIRLCPSLVIQPMIFVLVCRSRSIRPRVAQDLASCPAYADGASKFVLFQNGWGNAEAFSRYFVPERIYSARVITGFRRHQPNEVEITVHADAIHIGSLYAADVPALEELCRAIHTGGIRVKRRLKSARTFGPRCCTTVP